MIEKVVKICGDKVYVKEGKIVVRNSLELSNVINILKSSSKLQCKNIIDIVGIDEESRGIKLVYVLSSVRFSERLEVVVRVESNEIDSLCSLYKGADWLEREVYDMLGVIFIGHKNMRRLLTDYGFKGAPLKKSFKGFYDSRYDSVSKLVKKN